MSGASATAPRAGRKTDLAPLSGARSGRPRNDAATTALLDAAVDVLAETGLARMTVESVSERAGVSRSMLYRRWRSKDELVRDAVLRAFDVGVPIPDTGDLVEDLVRELVSVARIFGHPTLGRIVPDLLAEASRNSLWSGEVERLTEERRGRNRAVVRRAVDRGELPQGTDPDVLLDGLLGYVFVRCYFHRRPPRPRDIRSALRQMLDTAAYLPTQKAEDGRT